MTVNELMGQLKLAKNKDVQVVFKSGETLLSASLLAEVVTKNGNITYPSLGEVANAVVVKLDVIKSESGPTPPQGVPQNE